MPTPREPTAERALSGFLSQSAVEGSPPCASAEAAGSDRDAAGEAQLLTQLLVLFCPKRDPEDGDSAQSGAASMSASSSTQNAVNEATSRGVGAGNGVTSAEKGSAGFALRPESSPTGFSELSAIQRFLSLPRTSQVSALESIFAIPASLLSDFSPVLQFLMRVIMVVHHKAHKRRQASQPETSSQDAASGSQDTGTQGQPLMCGWERNGHVNCVEFEREEDTDEASASSSPLTSASFQFPPDMIACLTSYYKGGVQPLKCEEVWHGDHMAYRCRTCGLSDSSCMCLGCFDAEEHEGHDYRVYRCSSGGCCDCGDPLAWRPDGFCKKHRANCSAADSDDDSEQSLDEEEEAIVEMLVYRAIMFCTEVMREVYEFCLRPNGGGETESGHILRSVPKAGRRRSHFPQSLQLRFGRLHQSLAWLQMLTMSCLHYRDIVSQLFFEEMPPNVHLLSRPLGDYLTNTLRVGSDRRPSQPADSDRSDNADSSQNESNNGADGDMDRPLVVLDVFLKAGVLLPVDMCDVLGVLYLKLLFDHDFKQKYTCHFVDWYPYFIDVYMKASDESNEEGMRSLSRFIDRLFCQLFHSTAQLRELETVFATQHNTPHRLHVRQIPGSSLRSNFSFVEWLMVFLLERINGLFRSTLRSATIQRRPDLVGESDGEALDAGLVFQTIQVVDCSRSVFKKRIYARLCSDLRTLMVHPEITAQGILNSFSRLDDESTLREESLYSQLIQTFELLQQMDLQQRHVIQHVEYESQNWTFAFVADYELELLLSAFLTGVPACFLKDTWRTWEPTPGIVSEGSSVNPLNEETFDPVALAQAVLSPLKSAIASWSHRNGCPQLILNHAQMSATAANLTSLMNCYEHKEISSGGVNVKSFHLPLHHMYACTIYAITRVVCPKSLANWYGLLGVGSELPSPEDSVSTAFWYSIIDHPLRVLMFTREIKAGMWVRNGNVMLQQLIHYHSKHWRYYGLQSDIFLCQLGALTIPRGSFTRMLISQFPAELIGSTPFETDKARAEESKAETESARQSNKDREFRQQLDLSEEVFRLLLQTVLTPVKIGHAQSPDGPVRLLEREVMHWLSLGPFSRSEVLNRTDMKLVEQIKQMPDHEWRDLEDEEILSNVLKEVGEYDDPSARMLSGGGSASSGGSNNILGFGLKMSGTWKLKRDLWTQISPLFECFTPAESQQCEQNVRSFRPRCLEGGDVSTSGSLVLPVLPDSRNDMAPVLADRTLNSASLVGLILTILQEFKKASLSTHGSEDKAEALQLSDSFLVEALNCLYVGVLLLSERDGDGTNEHGLDLELNRDCTDLKSIADFFKEESSIFAKLRVEVPLGLDRSCISVLSMLDELQRRKDAPEDVRLLADIILKEATRKSSPCLAYVEKLRGSSSTTVKSGDNVSDNVSHGEAVSSQEAKKQAQEMMRRRQQLILEKMRSQQMKFLSSHGESVNDNGGYTGSLDENGDASDDTEDENDDDGEEEEEEEEDEWGFPTGHVDVNIYLDHISSAITVLCEHDKSRLDRKNRRRRSLRRNSLPVSLNDRSSNPKVDTGNQDECAEEECGLCRTPCDPQALDSSFGYVGMILPSKLASRLQTNAEPAVSQIASSPALRVLMPGADAATRLQLNDAVVWSCGHSIHHACLKAYLLSLWKQKGHRSAFELVNGEERLLSERDMEFVCPICRRLSNCLVPSVPSVTTLHERFRPTFGSIEFEFEDESKDDSEDPVVFLPWLDAQMTFRDDSPEVKRRRSRAMSSLGFRASKSSVSDNERNVTLEREIGAFCHDIVLFCARSQLHLPLVMNGTISEDNGADLELQQIGSQLGAQIPAWHLLLRCLEVQINVVAREKQLLGADSVDKWQIKSIQHLAEVAVAAATVSAHSSLAWTVIDAPPDRHFELFMAKLNGVLFGQQVLFEEKGTGEESAISENTIYGDWIEDVLVGTPLLAHPNLFSCYLMRLVWKMCGQTQSADSGTEAMVRESFFSARVFITAKLLQSICSVCINLDKQEQESEGNSNQSGMPTGVDHFDEVESLRDAFGWMSRLLTRARLIRPSNEGRSKYNVAEIEETLSAMCLPLAQQILLLMDVLLPLSGFTGSSGNQCTDPESDNPCAVCDGLFPAVPEGQNSSSTIAELDRCLRRLHLPPLRLFFHHQTFPPSQRNLCQLWGAQLESKAAVSRQQLQTLSSTSFTASTPSALSPSARRFDLRRQMEPLVARDMASATKQKPRMLIELPRVYMDLVVQYNNKPTGQCHSCNQIPQHPGICLFCGAVVCCFSPCCMETNGGGVGECTQHAQSCGAGFGAFLLLRACTVILFLGNERRCVWGSLYVDKNGEEDPYLRRGKALFLDAARLLALETLLISHAFSQNTTILANTSRRDGRRY